MNPTPHLSAQVAALRRRQRGPLLAAAVCAAAAAAAAVALLGLSGWFITGAALAGLAGLAAAQAFNVLLPSACIRLLAIIRTAARYGERLTGHQAALGALASLRPALFAALAAAPPAQALALSGGEASARLVQDVDALETRLVRLSAPWSAAAAVAAGVALAALAGWGPALVTLLAALAAVLLGRALARRLSSLAGERLQRAMGQLKDETATLTGASAELRAYGLEAWALDRVDARGQAVGAARIAVAEAQAWSGVLQSLVVGATVVAILVLARVAPLPIAALAALAATMTLDGVLALVRAFEQDGASDEAGRRLEAILRHAPGLDRGPDAHPRLLAPAIALRGLEPWTEGARIAVTGPSGGGKTTLVEQLIGLRPIAAGAVRLGGADLARLDVGVARAVFAHAPQDAALIAGTVADNLRLAAPEAEAETLWRALRDAALDQRVRALPQGLDTWIGEAGERLSGGERRRLCLARALLRPAPWLLLDEPTEGLDRDTEARVLAGLAEHLARTGQGLVMVAHRPAALAFCPRRIEIATPGNWRSATAEPRPAPAVRA